MGTFSIKIFLNNYERESTAYTVMHKGETSKRLNRTSVFVRVERPERVISLIFYCPTDLSDRILRATCRCATNHSI